MRQGHGFGRPPRTGHYRDGGHRTRDPPPHRDCSLHVMRPYRGEAPNGDLPRLGSYGKKMVGFVSELRAARVPLKVIPRIIHSVARVSMSASTANSIMARTADALEGQASEIAKNVAKSESAGFDETMHRDCGTKKQTNVAQSGKQHLNTDQPKQGHPDA